MNAIDRRLCITLGLLFSNVGAIGSPSASDCIKLSADVATAAVLRAQPNTSSDRIGALKPGEQLPFVRSEASWYETRLNSGTTAFVSKRWSQVSSCVALRGPSTARAAETGSSPAPLLAKDHPVDWWFVFKLNAVKFPGCGNNEARKCPFGGTAQTYADGQQFVFASSDSAELKQGAGCAGTTEQDPIGATYDEIYNGHFSYVVWNDQFKGDPNVTGCGANCNSPWGHSKGMVAWNDAGDAIVMQVTTPSWPGAGNQDHPRRSDGNTLGCVEDDNVKFSQHFFALKLTKDDLLMLLYALQNASVGTDPTELQIVSNGGPADVQSVVSQLGHRSSSTHATLDTLSSGVRLISKPSALHVPPWQLVSSLLGGVPLRAATWWTSPAIDSTTATTVIQCWDNSLGHPGAVEIATSGTWNGTPIGLKGLVADGNHAKIGVSTDETSGFAVFGDMNQQGTLSGPKCDSSQNGRGGMFFVLQDAVLSKSIAALIGGESAPTH